LLCIQKYNHTRDGLVREPKKAGKSSDKPAVAAKKRLTVGLPNGKSLIYSIERELGKLKHLSNRRKINQSRCRN